MKTRFKGIVLFLLIMLAVPLKALAEQVEHNGIMYDISDQTTTATVVSKDGGYSGDIVIPEWFVENGLQYTVTTIGNYAFSGSKGMTSVTIPNSVTTISYNAFNECSGLTSLSIPNSVTTIDASAFYGCSGLTSVSIPGSVTSIGEYAFANCQSLKSAEFASIESLCRIQFDGIYSNPLFVAKTLYINGTPTTEVVIPNTVTSIGALAFHGYAAMTSVTIPNSVTSIGESAFLKCTGLTSVTIPNSVTTIGEYAFSECIELSSVTIPNSVTSIGTAAFNSCSSLTSVTIPNSVTSISDYTFAYCNTLASVTIPNSITSIGNNAFFVSGLSSLTIPSSVTSIGRLAFEQCYNLESVLIPESVTSIGEYAFRFNYQLKWVFIGNPDLELPENAFDESNNLDIVFCPEGFEWNGPEPNIMVQFDPETTEILEDGTVLTDNGKKLLAVQPKDEKTYTIPDGVEVIGEYAFSETYSLESLTIPASLTSIEADAFKNCPVEKVNFLDWEKWYTGVELGNFYSNPYWNGAPYAGGVKITTPELKEGMTEIPDYKNYGLQFKDEVDLPTTIKRIGAYAFYKNKELYTVFLPEGLEEIGEYAFAECELLENPVFPAGLKKIEDAAYYACTKITEITLPTGLSYLGEMTPKDEMIGWQGITGIFEGCTALEKAVLVCDIDYLDDKLLYGCTSLQTLFMPLQLKTIGAYALSNTALDEITFPATLETIGEYAFANDGINGTGTGEGKGFSNVVIPNSVTSLGKGAFSYQSITSLTLGTGLTVIPEQAFYRNLIQQINFSEGLVEIESEAFSSSWSTISSVNLPSTVTTIGTDAFLGTMICEMNVPDKVMSLPAGSCGTPSVLNLGSGIKEIAADAFSFEKLYTLRLRAVTPPTLSEAFPLTEEQNDQLTLIVNSGRKPYYVTNARWKQIDRIIEDGESEVDIFMTGDYSLANEIRTTTGLMPAAVTKMKVTGPLTEKDLLTIQQNMPALTSLDMQNVTNVTAIPDNLLEGSLITEIILPANLETIGASAFANCRLLQINELPASLKTIGDNAFNGSVRVQLPEFPASVETIGSYAFANTAMQEFIAPESLTSLGSGAFRGCNLLERVDVSASALTEINYMTFEGCSELDEVILSENVESIGSMAFSGTALRNIDFCNDVTAIGAGAFSNNRRLVAANLPKAIEAVEASLFADCPRMLAVSMPTTTTSVGESILQGDRKLSNISCAALEAPETVKNTFNGLRMRYVSLIVPRQSYRSYLDALGWGSFETIKNTIPVEIDEGVQASTVSEEEYQEMLQLDALEEAEEEASKEESPAAAAKAARRAKARANTPQYFASLFNGAQIQTGDEDSGMRIFINPKEDVEITSILFDGVELLPEYVKNNSILLAKGSRGTLKILTDAKAVIPSVKLNLEEAEVNEGGSVQLTATVTPADAKVTWSSSNESIATVDPNGLVTAIKAGKATITAKTAEAEASCEVTVKAVAQSSLTLNLDKAELNEGETVQLTATATPADAQVTWSSSDESIATVDQNGLVTAIKAGKATITAKTAEAEASCEITVKAVAQASLTLNVDKAELTEGETMQLTATATPADAQVVWSSSDESIATVDRNGLVTAVKAGKVTITAKTPEAEASCEITVKAASGIDDIESESAVSVTAYNGAIIVTAPEAAVVEIYTVSGQLLEQTAEHRIEGLNAGFYVIRVGNSIFKVVL